MNRDKYTFKLRAGTGSGLLDARQRHHDELRVVSTYLKRRLTAASHTTSNNTNSLPVRGPHITINTHLFNSCHGDPGDLPTTISFVMTFTSDGYRMTIIWRERETYTFRILPFGAQKRVSKRSGQGFGA